MLGFPFSFKVYSDPYNFSVTKTPSEKSGALTCPMRFFFFALFLYKSAIALYKKYCCHAWAGAPIYSWILLHSCRNGYMLQFILYLLLLLNTWLMLKFSQLKSFLQLLLFTIVDAHLNWLNWFHSLIFSGSPLIILMGCMIFLPYFPDVTARRFMLTVCFLHMQILEFFSCRMLFLTYDIEFVEMPFIFVFFLSVLLYAFYLGLLFITSCLLLVVQLCME